MGVLSNVDEEPKTARGQTSDVRIQVGVVLLLLKVPLVRLRPRLLRVLLDHVLHRYSQSCVYY